MSPSSAAARHLAVIEAGARALNDELTILASAEDAVDAQPALKRAIWHVAVMMHYANRQRARTSAVTLERVVEG
jgi:hypothetical protein